MTTPTRHSTRLARWSLAIALILNLSPAHAAQPDYSSAAERLGEIIHEQMRTHGIGGVSVALIDDQETVFADGYGDARRDSIFRCGSISKLLNAVAVMQQVESGALDLDAPIRELAPDLAFLNPFEDSKPVTLRQLLCHRSGMIRESPVGGYFDDSEPGLDNMIASLRSCVLVNSPDTQTRYSNVGPSIAGHIVSKTSGIPYARHLRDQVLAPLGMNSSYSLLRHLDRDRLLPGHMRVAKTKGGFERRRAPFFDLGTIPAGNLFTTVDDLARFVSLLAAEGRTPNGRVLSKLSLDEMFTPQLTDRDSGFGLGFAIGQHRDYRRISHNGAVYGYSSALVFLPGPKLGVVVLSNEDIVLGVIHRIAYSAVSLMLQAKNGDPLPERPNPAPIPRKQLAEFVGDYESESYWARIELNGDELSAVVSGQKLTLTPVGPRNFLANGRLEDDTALDFIQDEDGRIVGFTFGQRYQRVAVDPTRSDKSSIPEEWRAYLGSYGPSFIPLIISERHGHLYAMTENMLDYRLHPVSRHVFALPPGLYTDEHLVFLVNPRGRPHAVDLANMILKRR